MGLEQDANWGVTHAWFDVLMGTRVEYEYDERGRVKRPARDGAAALPRSTRAWATTAPDNDQKKSAA